MEAIVSASIVIRSPLLEVFDYVSDPARLPEWVPLYEEIVEVNRRSKASITKGDRFKAKLSLVPGIIQSVIPEPWRIALSPAISPEVDVAVDDVVHGRRLVYRATTGWTSICNFQPAGDSTILEMSHSLWSLQGIVAGYWAGPVQALANDMVRRILEGLRWRLEGRAVEPEPRIFFSYRRDDARYVGGRVFDALTAEFGLGTVFRDSESLLPGGDWADDISKAIKRCRVVVVHIGDNWEKDLDKHDALRGELEAALEEGSRIRIVPVLTSERDDLNVHTRMREIEAGLKCLELLPEEKKTPGIVNKFTARLQAQRIREDPDFDKDLERLMRAVWAVFRSVDAPVAGPPCS